MCMYASEICAEGISVTFPWWLKNVKSRSKIALFFKWAPLWNLFPKKRTITFFWSKLSKLHKKDPILHVATTFSLKQGETRTSHGPIPHPLNLNAISEFLGQFTIRCIYHFSKRWWRFCDRAQNMLIYFLVRGVVWWGTYPLRWRPEHMMMMPSSLYDMWL